MSYRAKVVNVMIASPSDIVGERFAVRNVIHEWNYAHSQDKNIVLMPVGWETHAAPALGDRPQGIINKQVLKNCDLLVAVFWTKLGTPTGKALSGTVEEIEEHLKARKPVMIYFSSIPVAPATVDPKQMQALQDFKDKLAAKGLYAEYNSEDDFRAKFARQLAQTVNRHFAPKKNGGNDEADGEIFLPKVPMLSEPARIMLIEASRDRYGTILKMRSKFGITIQTEDGKFLANLRPSSAAHWEAAIGELRDQRLLQNTGRNGEIYAVTDAGSRVAELLQERRPAPH